eukprot:8910942-Pyramimonas_sp.AAC.1
MRATSACRRWALSAPACDWSPAPAGTGAAWPCASSACKGRPRVYSHDGPIRRRKRGYILTTYQSQGIHSGEQRCAPAIPSATPGLHPASRQASWKGFRRPLSPC